MPAKRLPMGALENTVMDVLWEDGGWLIPSQVHARLPGEREPGYTTIMTTLVRLHRKGRLERRKEGRAFAYHASSTRAEWAASRMDEVLDLAGERGATLASFVERLDAKERSELLRMLAERREP